VLFITEKVWRVGYYVTYICSEIQNKNEKEERERDLSYI